jgi:hypothetical protein
MREKLRSRAVILNVIQLAMPGVVAFAVPVVVRPHGTAACGQLCI